jgi:hypothetical protein
MNNLTEYDFDAHALFRVLDRWLKRHRKEKECEVIPKWAYSPIGVECKVEVCTGSSCESIFVARISPYGHGNFDFPYLRPKRHGAEALAYAWIVAAYLEEKGIRVRLKPTVDALAKLQSFILLPEGQILMN